MTILHGNVKAWPLFLKNRLRKGGCGREIPMQFSHTFTGKQYKILYVIVINFENYKEKKEQ